MAVDRSGRSMENQNEGLSLSWRLVPGFFTGVSRARSRGWGVVRQGPFRSMYRRHGALTVWRRVRLSAMVPALISDKERSWSLSSRARWQTAAPDHTSYL